MKSVSNTFDQLLRACSGVVGPSIGIVDPVISSGAGARLCKETTRHGVTRSPMATNIMMVDDNAKWALAMGPLYRGRLKQTD